jgi:hypothetical protein
VVELRAATTLLEVSFSFMVDLGAAKPVLELEAA